MGSVIETEIRFSSGDGSCAGTLYRPDGPSSPQAARPVVVLGHGLGAIRQMRLPAYARRFAQEGYLALAFDYRHFGESTGEPRQLLSIHRQQEDWRAAVGYARTIPGADPDKVAVFGTSFGGGHVIELAGKDPSIAAVISQCPFTNGVASLFTVQLPGLIGVSAAAALDIASALLRRAPRLVPLAGDTGTVALMNAPDAKDGFLGLVPEGQGFTNAAAARIGAQIPLWRPGRHAKAIKAPIYFAICDKDTVAPAGPTAKYAAKAPRGVVKHYPFGHFDIYVGAAFDEAIEDYVAFLGEHLPAPTL
ncbi:MAG: alpha/beta hydrolase [Segniliparus sp.]|uniref:alpha/beta hydrolase n=1 Tax=Segniliparus sp. TaxID=2804064 RepID=UPI003F30F77C